jgi:hypothetical protein
MRTDNGGVGGVIAFLAVALSIPILVILGIATDSSEKNESRKAIVGPLSRISAQYDVAINGRRIPDAPFVIRAIRDLRDGIPHHSHPLTPMTVRVFDEKTAVEFVIARDSDRPDEYWIFRPGPNAAGDPRGREIGRVMDPQLTAYLRKLGLDTR